MIVRRLITKPIAVSMCVIAIVVLGIISSRFLPVSLMPDIDIPHITVQASYPGLSAIEAEGQVISPLRGSLTQVAGLKNISTIARMDAGTISMSFEPGSRMDLIFIEVNEKIDRVMNRMHEHLERPKVIKASAMDIPAFSIDLTLADEDALRTQAGVKFAQVGDFARNIVSKRIEQLPQTAMVDISGTVGSEIICTPDENIMTSMGITMVEIENAVKGGNFTMGTLSIVNGDFRYNIHFDAELVTKEDIENIYINHEGRMLQLKDICSIEERPGVRNGIVRHDARNAVSLAVIKQNDAQMDDLQEQIDGILKDLRKNYPKINFDLTRDQTQLLTFSMDNLKSNLYIGIFLACIVLFFFMRDRRLPVLVIITIPLVLVLTLIVFFLCGISLNIVSLSGLILGIGMIVDNSIIVIDNIVQKWKSGLNVADAVVKGTNEVFTPMLSSVLTTCSVFIPLIFLSGVAGSLFYDQAMGVTIALSASLFVAVLVIPVYFYAIYKKYPQAIDTVGRQKRNGSRWTFYTPYEKVMRWTLRHPVLHLAGFLIILPLMYLIYGGLKKEIIPYIAHQDATVSIDWNAGISLNENDRRVYAVMDSVKKQVETYTSMIGTQDFLLSHTPDITTSEAFIYMKARSEEELMDAEQKIADIIEKGYPGASVDFAVSGNLFDLIFSRDEPDLEIRLQNENGNRPVVKHTRDFIDTLSARFPELYFQPVVVESNIQYSADASRMAQYGISFSRLSGRLKELVSKHEAFHLNNGGKPIPIIIGRDSIEGERLLDNKIRNSKGVEIPLNYIIRSDIGEDYKQLHSAEGGGYYPIRIYTDDEKIEEVMSFTRNWIKENGGYSASFTGGYFSSREMISELVLVLLVAIGLLFFILAAQFESLVQPFLILSELLIDLFWVFLVLFLMGESLNIMSMIGIVVMSGIVINDSILKVDTINRYRHSNMSLLKALLQGGHDRLKPIIMTSLTTILAVVPFLSRGDMGSALQFPLSLTLIIGMIAGTCVSLFVVPLFYYLIYCKKNHGSRRS